jgi:adenosylcobinamide kinase/adenosylcobinamide-phosphate guanylyltransferase
MNKRLILILGGARSGKSSYAQRLAGLYSESVLYVATAEADDDEMDLRIAMHKDARPEHWQTLEVSSKVGEVISYLDYHADVVILDCLTLLTSNIISFLDEPITYEMARQATNNELDDLLATYNSEEKVWIIVSNEVGLGLVPPYPLGRVYRDVLGRANQRLATEADEVIFMVAGLPMLLKGEKL